MLRTWGRVGVDWLVEHEDRTNGKPSSSHIPEGAQNPRKKSDSVLFPGPCAGRGEHHGRGLHAKTRIRNQEFCRSKNDVILAQQPSFGEIKGASFSVGGLLFCVHGVRVCVCMHVCTHAYTPTRRGLCGAEYASVSSSIFNIFKILNENVAVNFKLIWMDSNKMQTSLQIRIFSEDF